jgi:hypothetical protein
VNRTFVARNLYGKSEEEAPPQNEQAQAPKALEVQSPQKAHVAEIDPTALLHKSETVR